MCMWNGMNAQIIFFLKLLTEWIALINTEHEVKYGHEYA